ncbi:MAG TPA: D-aminoacyl-tRNA deacylase [Bacilli bacterium]|jgi:D-tyrosyl-tRNA(Tyr) deacylase|nr:D-tyrosyl-tRNA(Tyr) deacylase [Acholeplasmataceae bacterium]HNZ78240.1 D-aminoacyl-tRNA deacylase [Bacilli bacterium]HOD60757.1 D-aminoacyl-tRNA deacylase [Bacilli bacterium]HOH61699.1 D-aminoacyl-tRNA deacylase [Bacilli bacterium]HPB49209.1 D-aminoacyl-tRNA deacylase [Bacilli bacterium]
MKIVLQRVKKAKCTVDGKITGAIEQGYLLLVGYTHGDDLQKNQRAAKKIANLRIFEDENEKMNLDIKKVNGKILAISQFTLYANTNDGNRPSFIEALHPVPAKELYLDFCKELRTYGLEVYEGIFGAHMDIELINDGPVTIQFEF